MKYGWLDSGPLVVTVWPLIERWYWSAVASQIRASAGDACCWAMVAAATSPAISAAIVYSATLARRRAARAATSSTPLSRSHPVPGRDYFIYSGLDVGQKAGFPGE